MKINNIQINGFGNLKNKNLELKSGINLVCGNNEVGKSTLANFIKAIFYGVNRNKNGATFSEYEKYKPWGEGEFSGKITYEIDNKKYSAIRDFNRNNCKIFDGDGNDISNNFNKDKSRGAEIGLEQLEIDEETFFNSIFVSQSNIIVDSNGRKNVMQKLTNMIQSGDEAISYDKAKQKLQKRLLEDVGTERTQNKPLNMVEREINLLEDKKQNLVLNREKQITIGDKEKEIEKKLSNAEADLEKISRVIEIKERYANLLKERENDFEIAVKIAEKEYKKKVEIKEKNRKMASTLSITATIVLFVILMLFKWYLIAGISFVAGIILTIVLYKVLSLDVKKGTVPNFDAIREDFKKKEDRELELLRKDGIKESLTSRKILELNQLQDGIKHKRDDLVLEKHKLKIESESLKENLDRLNELEERLEYLYEKETGLRKLEYSLKLAISKLEIAYEKLKDEVVPELENAIKNNIIETTNKEYTNVYYNDNQGILVENSLGDIVTIDKLSFGTIEQAYLGFRLAIAGKVANLPLILDESFVYYDNERLENIFKTFNEKYKDRQIIILSCSDREKRILEKLDIDYNLVNI